jgi:methyl-accepting chemotaxis protein
MNKKILQLVIRYWDWVNTFSIRFKLTCAFTILIFLMLITGFTGYRGMKSSGRAQDAMTNQYLPLLISISRIQYLQSEIKASQSGLLVNDYVVEEKEYLIDIIQKYMKDLDAELRVFDSIPKEPEDIELGKSLQSAVKAWKSSSDTFIRLVQDRISMTEKGVKENDPSATSLDVTIMESYNTDVLYAFVRCANGVQSILDLENNHIKTQDSISDNTLKSSVIILIIILVTGFLISILVAFWMATNMDMIVTSIVAQVNDIVKDTLEGKLDSRVDLQKTNFQFREITAGINTILDTLISPIKMAANHVDRISKGDIPPLISNDYYGDFNDIKNNLNMLIQSNNEIAEKARMIADGDLTIELKKRSGNDALIESISEMIRSISVTISDFSTAAENISSSSQQMSSTAQMMSQGATEQASSAEEVSSSMEEMSANIQQNTENAQQTQKISMKAAEGIKKINTASDQVVKYMEEIADKVSIIGDIARNTNILALNAAVEAARAGEHGRGFAVVASEVRKLAERSQAAAVEIEALTQTSVAATEESSRLLTEIAPEIEKTSKLVQEIATASLEQNAGADQVNNAIQQLNQITQQNAAASEEVATSSEELSGQADQLLEKIGYFKLPEELKFSGESKARPSVVTREKIFSKPGEDEKNTVVRKSKSVKTGFNFNLDRGDAIDNEYEKF